MWIHVQVKNIYGHEINHDDVKIMEVLTTSVLKVRKMSVNLPHRIFQFFSKYPRNNETCLNTDIRQMRNETRVQAVAVDNHNINLS